MDLAVTASSQELPVRSTGPVRLDGATTADAVVAIARGAPVVLDAVSLSRVGDNRAALESLIADGTPVYGITTGFGALVSELV